MTATPHPNRQTCQPTTASTGRKTRTLSGKPASPPPAAKMNEQAQRLYGRNDHTLTPSWLKVQPVAPIVTVLVTLSLFW